MKQTCRFIQVCLLAFLVGLFIATLFTACSGKRSETKDSLASDTPFDTLTNFCNWNEVGIREQPDEKSKYLTTIYLGEQFAMAGDTSSTLTKDGRVHYHKIKLTDGKEGWIRDEFIAIQAVPAVFLKNY